MITGMSKHFYFLMLLFVAILFVTESNSIRRSRATRTRRLRRTRKVVTKKCKKYEDERQLNFKGIHYSNNMTELKLNVDSWIYDKPLRYGPANAIIVPHSDLNVCGNVTGTGFRQVDPKVVKRIFLFGPSHYINFKNCMLTNYSYYRSPFGHIKIDSKMNEKLSKKENFLYLDKKLDNEEHSLENVLPFISRMMKNRKFTLVPLIVGNLPSKKMKAISKIFVKYLPYEENLFVISSDLCHWGEKYRFTEGGSESVEETILDLDRKAVLAIKNLKPKTFENYLESYKSRICGKASILLFLHMCRILYNKYFVLGIKVMDHALYISENFTIGCGAVSLVIF